MKLAERLTLNNIINLCEKKSVFRTCSIKKLHLKILEISQEKADTPGSFFQ